MLAHRVSTCLPVSSVTIRNGFPPWTIKGLGLLKRWHRNVVVWVDGLGRCSVASPEGTILVDMGAGEEIQVVGADMGFKKQKLVLNLSVTPTEQCLCSSHIAKYISIRYKIIG